MEPHLKVLPGPNPTFYKFRTVTLKNKKTSAGKETQNESSYSELTFYF